MVEESAWDTSLEGHIRETSPHLTTAAKARELIVRVKRSWHASRA
jgi:hypothetical protein